MSLVAEREAIRLQPQPRSTEGQRSSPAKPLWAYVATVIVGLLLLEVFGGFAYAAAATVLAAALFLVVYLTGDRASRTHLFRRKVDRRDLMMIFAIYGFVLALYRVAFVVVEDSDMLLFAFYAFGLVVGVGAPIVYTVWQRKRPLASLGLSLENLPRVAVLALVFAAVQFSITLWGYDLPGTRAWATLLGMALMVGVFESIFFRGFVQGRLQASFGAAPAVFGAALLYGLYHVGYGMGLEESLFLGGLGIVYALAYLTTENVLVLWPLLTPLGSWFAQLEDGELLGRLPWASLLGFADVVAVMGAIIWLAHRHERKAKKRPVSVRGG